MKKRCFNIVFAFLFTITSLLTSSFAHATISNDDALLANGFLSAEVKSLSDDQKAHLVYELQNNPENVQTVTYVVEIDELSVMRDFKNCTDEELLVKGYSSEFIEENRILFDSYLSMTSQELADWLNTSEDTAITVQQTLSGNNVQTRAISNSKLEIRLSVGKYSNPAPYAVRYTVLAGFTWLSQPMIAITDRNGENFGIKWGYGPGVLNYNSTIEYYLFGKNIFDGTASGDVKYGYGITYDWCWKKTQGGKEGYAESGGFTFDIASNTYSGFLTTVSAVYGHKTAKVNGIGINIAIVGSSIGVLPSFNLDYDHFKYSNEKKVDIRI